MRPRRGEGRCPDEGLAEKIEMDQKRIKVGDFPLLQVIFGKWVNVIIGLVEGRLEAAEQGGHGQVHVTVAEINCRIDEDSLAGSVTEKITAP